MLLGLCLPAMAVSIACNDKHPDPIDPPLPPPPPVTKDDGIHYIQKVKHIRTFAEKLAPVTNEYAITYTESDSEGHRSISQVAITSDANGTKNSVTYTYTYDE